MNSCANTNAADDVSAVSLYVIPAKPRKTGREAGSRIAWIHYMFLDSGFRRNDGQFA